MRNRDVKKQEFEDFYQEAKNPCFRALCVTVPSFDEAEELLAEAFARAFSDWSKVKKHKSPRAWVVRTALNLHRDNWRKKNTNKRHLVAVSESYNDKSQMLDPELIRQLRSLPDQQRLVIAHRVLLDLSTEQTAQALQIAPGTVSVHLKRGLATLREILSNQSMKEVINE